MSVRLSPAIESATPETIALPYRFDTATVWHTILKGAFALNAVLVIGIAFKLFTGDWLPALGVVVMEAIVFGFTRLFLRFQSGSRGTLYRDRVEIQPNALFGIPLPGPRGVYARERFAAVRVELMMGSINVDGPSGGPHELLWLAGRDGTPDVLVARTDQGAGRVVGAELGTLLELPVDEKNAPKVITL
jgi:hypothetical protein